MCVYDSQSQVRCVVPVCVHTQMLHACCYWHLEYSTNVRLLLDRACALILIKNLNEGVLPRSFTTEYSQNNNLNVNNYRICRRN